MLDVIFFSNNSIIYQELSKKYSAIETQHGLCCCESCRSKGFKVDILDCLAESK